MKAITINLPEEVELDKVKMIIAASLFEQGILSSGQAAEIVGITRRKFLEEVGKYGVSIFGETVEDIEKVGDIFRREAIECDERSQMLPGKERTRARRRLPMN